MGFHVTVRDGDRRLLEALRSDPSEVFGRPYLGYLLFLVGGNDLAALEWLRSHLVSLDSLTGHHVAYGIFANRVPLHLEIPSYYEGLQSHRFLGEISLSDAHRIDSYIKSGRVGQIASGDHLVAMTYATDRVARAFGVLDHLPCVMILDAFPSDEVDLIELSPDQVPELLPLLRSAMHRLTQDSSHAEAIAALELLGRLRQRLAASANELRMQKAIVAGIPIASAVVDLIRHAFLGMEGSIRLGAYGAFKDHLDELRQYADELPANLAQEQRVRLVGYAKTIKALDHFLAIPWPLSEPEDRQLRQVIDRHVSRLLSDLQVSRDVKRAQLLEVKELLVQRQSILVHEVMDSLPSEEGVLSKAQDCFSRREAEAVQRAKVVTAEIEKLRADARSGLDLWSSGRAPSFRGIVVKAAREKKLKLMGASVLDKATAYAGALLDPERLLKVLAGAAGSSM